ncbi:MAG: hypothetical protein K0Q50_882 [Vampirovibrio sp.]|jgi:hypothetical protein|nr:hypothetical protein [Vampirovibrio sp.]
MISDYEQGKREVLEKLVAKYKALETEECPDCNKPSEEAEWQYCDIICFQMNLITGILRECGYALEGKERNLVKYSP